MHFTNVNKRLSEDNLLSKIISINLFNKKETHANDYYVYSYNE